MKLKLAEWFIKAGHRLGPWAQNLPAAFLSADELVALTRRYYSRPDVVGAWTQNIAVKLTAAERLFLKKYAAGRPRVLVLGSGAGRESLVMARRGMRVTAVDHSSAMMRALQKAAGAEGLRIDVIEGDFLGLTLARGDAHDLLFLGSNYAHIPTRPARIAFLKKMKSLLANDGRLFLSFLCRSKTCWSVPGLWFHRFCALVCGGNFGVQEGDEIRGEGEFLHQFGSASEVLSEVREAGFALDAGVEKENVMFLKPA